MEEILIANLGRRKLTMDYKDDGSVELFEQIGVPGARASIDIVHLSKDEALKLRNILNGLFGGSEC